ncbi:MAG: aldo/keto reductase, partial [Candidatus Poribacteria bacterium]|nr:aldo/keto reductase [Candidatus Poribacteria bacterium]
MRTKTLGRTGLDVSIVGLGAAFIGIPHPNSAPLEYSGKPGQMDEELGVKTAHAAIESGCALIDTAVLYGKTRSEQIIGQALRERPDLKPNVTVTTKAGRTGDGTDYTYDAVRKHVEGSLERLGLERLEVVYIHDQMGAPMELVMGDHGTLGALRRFQKEGVVGYVGTAANDPTTNAPYIETGEFDAAVVPEAWSLLNQLALERILPAAVKHNVGLVIATPLERGLLATGPVEGIDYLARKFSQRCLAHVTKIQGVCREWDIPMGAAALQWCVRHPQVAATIPGARVPDEATANGEAG